jgi:hypothetical protein
MRGTLNWNLNRRRPACRLCLAFGITVLFMPPTHAQELPLAQAAKGPPRTYAGRVMAEWLDDGRRMRLLDDFAYFDDRGLRWNAPKGSMIEAATVPRMAWTAVSARPFDARYRNASIIHDVACVEKRRPWQLVHEAFYGAMLTSEVPKYAALLLYGAAYHFGPRWVINDVEGWMKADPRVTEPGLGEPQPPATEENVKRLEAAVQAIVAGTDLFMVDDEVVARRVREIRFAPR